MTVFENEFQFCSDLQATLRDFSGNQTPVTLARFGHLNDFIIHG